MSKGKKSAVVYMIASYIHYAISFLVTPVFSRILSTEDFGLITTYNSWVEMIMPIATLSLYSGFFSVGMVDYEDQRDRFESSVMGLSIVFSIGTGLLFSMIALFFPKLVGLPISLLVLMDLYFIMYPATRLWQARERFEYRYKALFFVMIAISVLTPTLGLLFVCLNKTDLAIYRLYGTNLVSIFISTYFLILIFKKGKVFYNKEIWKSALLFCLPLIPHYLAMHVLSASDKVMINNIVGSHEAGIYGMAYTAGTVVTAAWTAINGSLSPYVLTKLKRNDYSDIGKTGTLCIVLFSSVCLLVCIVAPEVITILGGEKYKESISLLPPIIAAVLFMEMYNLFSLIEFYYKKTKMIMVATVVAALLNVVLNYYCIQAFGYKAAAYTTLICYVFYCIFHYYNMRKIEKNRIYNPKLLLSFSILYVAACFGCLALYGLPIIRYSALALTATIIVVFHKKIYSFIQRMKV